MGINHIAIILDGNRRYARKKGLMIMKGHDSGAKALRRLLKWGAGLNGEDQKKYWAKELTLFIFSMQNFNRTEAEKRRLFRLFVSAFKELYKSKEVEKLCLRVNFLGRLHLLPEQVQNAINLVKEKTENYKKHVLNFCVAYGGREEIIDAVNRILKEGREGPITEGEFEDYLYSKSEPDIVIRTSGEYRTSNFLIWQANYSEWFFLKKTWPEFGPRDYMRVVEEFLEHRERRFGR